MVLGDPANTVLQPSMRDVMKACTRVFNNNIYLPYGWKPEGHKPIKAGSKK